MQFFKKYLSSIITAAIIIFAIWYVFDEFID